VADLDQAKAWVDGWLAAARCHSVARANLADFDTADLIG